MECPNCFYLPAPGEAPVEGPCPNCGVQPERDQPSGMSTDFQTFGMPAPGEDDGNNGNPLAEGTIVGSDGERPLAKRDNFMGSIQPPLWYSASELPEDPDVPMDMVDVIEAEDLPKKRKDRDLDSVKEAGLLGTLLGGVGGFFLGGPLGAARGALMGNSLGNAAGSLVKRALGGGDGGQAQAPGFGAQAPSYYSRTADIDTNPVGNDSAPYESDNGDSKGHADGDHSLGLQVGDDVNDIGGAQTPTHGFSDDSLGRLLSMLPVLLGHAAQGGTGGNDPLVQALHQSLDSEVPGYLDTHTDPQAHATVMMILKGDDDKGHDPMNETPQDQEVTPGHEDDSNESDHIDTEKESSLHQALLQNLQLPGPTTMRPDDAAAQMQQEQQGAQAQGHCQNCGGTIGPSDKACPQCGAPNSQTTLGLSVAALPNSFEYEMTTIPPDMTIKDWHSAGKPVHCDHCGNPTVEDGVCKGCGTAKKVAAGIGPQTDEQKAAVSQLLLEQGRQEEIPVMLTNPQAYADELAQIQGHDRPPQPDQDPGPPPPAVESAPPGQTMPVPGMSAPAQGAPQMGTMAAALAKLADFSHTRFCPTCFSQQLQPLEDGSLRCAGCGSVLKNEDPYADQMQEIQGLPEVEHPLGPHTGAGEDHVRQHGDHFDNQVAVDAADQVRPEDPEKEQDSGHTWVDEDGNPIKVGQEYEMFSANYDIPDMVRIEAVKPDAIQYTLTGEYGLEHTTEITWEEAQIENLSFVPANVNHPDDVQDPSTASDVPRPAPGDQTDLSSDTHNFGLMASAQDRDWLKEGGAKFTPMEQREFIEEAGIARNSDRLDLSNTHYESSSSRVEVIDDFFLFGL